MNLAKSNHHLTDDALFALALPAAGMPEALPAHLSDCLACTRALSEWKNAVRDLAAEGERPIARRSPESWAAAEERTMQAIRRSRFAGRAVPLRWAVGIAASILLFVLALPIQRAASHRSAAAVAASDLSAEDQADDALLRDVARLSRGDDGGNWSSLVPEPGRGDEDHL